MATGKESEGYYRGKIAGLERINAALLFAIELNLSTTADVIDIRMRVKVSVEALVAELNAHPTFTQTPFGNGASDAIAEFANKIFS